MEERRDRVIELSLAGKSARAIAGEIYASCFAGAGGDQQNGHGYVVKNILFCQVLSGRQLLPFTRKMILLKSDGRFSNSCEP